MFWHLIAAVSAALGAAGIALLLRLASGKRLPRWIIPAFAGLGMLGYQIHTEYSWAAHKQQQLPATATVVSIEQDGTFWRPWTYLFPLTSAFSVVDRTSMTERHIDDQHMVEFILYHFERRPLERVHHRTWLMNCTSAELAPLTNDQRPDVAAMRTLSRGAPLYQALCLG